MMRGERKKEIRCVNEQQNNGLKLILFILVREGGGPAAPHRQHLAQGVV